MIAQAKRGPAKGLWLAALLVASGVPLAAQKVPVDPNAIRNLLNQPANQPAPAQTTAKPATSAAPTKPVTATKPASQPPASAQTPAKPAVQTAGSSHPAAQPAKPATGQAPATAAAKTSTTQAATAPSAPHRDPFDPLIGKDKESAGGPSADRLPAGKAGLVITTLRVDGVVMGPGGMIAIVSNPQQRVYFLREGDQLYDGQVGRITMEAVAFHQTGKDPFGAPIERDVTKQLYPTPGEQP